MNLPRVRVTVRWLMVAVALIGLALGLTHWLRRRAERFNQLSRWHQRNVLEIAYGPGPFPEKEARLRHHRRLTEKYERAARHPYFSVAPDPPEPE